MSSLADLCLLHLSVTGVLPTREQARMTALTRTPREADTPPPRERIELLTREFPTNGPGHTTGGGVYFP